MVRGTSRRVIVVESPDTNLFEQAIFIVRNDALSKDGVTAQQLVDEACRVARSYTRSHSTRRPLLRLLTLRYLFPLRLLTLRCLLTLRRLLTLLRILFSALALVLCNHQIYQITLFHAGDIFESSRFCKITQNNG